MKKQWQMVGTTLLILVIVVFSWLNVQKVTVNFGITYVTMPLVIILVVSVLIGMLIAVSFSMMTILKLKNELKKTKQNLEVNKNMRRSTDKKSSEQKG
ncbi:LapA family protein [Ligilactobacillus sp. WILCCON 0076]|uniref:LapA family protein n=1 Tax=Ligilactobacillus ubinensis TaxID=2876789 RepID=A0A9X2FM04_9LACO|nr:LapA family protein [Ligilactobacillus ubinensis]MCP0886803.1 LapA family protein [Ligilactobacillus ubinensis]